MRHAYPLMLDLTGRLVVVVGGGAVAARKVRGLLAAGADRVRGVAPAFHATFPDAPGKVERIAARYEPGHLEGAGLVFAATDSPAVNAAVVRDARSRGLLVSRADAEPTPPEEPKPADVASAGGDFITPAKFQAGPVLVTVSTGSAALSARLRDELERRFDPAWAEWAAAVQSIRPTITRMTHLAPDARAAILRDLASPEALERTRTGGAPAVFAWIADRHPLAGPIEPRGEEPREPHA